MILIEPWWLLLWTHKVALVCQTGLTFTDTWTSILTPNTFFFFQTDKHIIFHSVCGTQWIVFSSWFLSRLNAWNSSQGVLSLILCWLKALTTPTHYQTVQTKNCQQCQKCSPYKQRGAFRKLVCGKKERNGPPRANQGLSTATESNSRHVLSPGGWHPPTFLCICSLRDYLQSTLRSAESRSNT